MTGHAIPDNSRNANATGTATRPGISVVIPNWNGLIWLPGCLNALAAQQRPPEEIIVVDNGSSDDSVPWLKQHHPDVTLITMGRNTGFAAAVNAGIRAARYDLICLLNNDTIPEPAWLATLHQALNEADASVGAVCGKMMQMDRPGFIENAGDNFSWQGAAEKRGHNQPGSRYTAPDEVFSVCAGGALYRKTFFDTTGLFDERFFAYLEDIDLGLRGRLMGYRYLYIPEAKIAHQGHGSQLPSTRYVRLTTANRLRIFAKNVPSAWLVRKLPSLLYGQWYFFIVHRKPLASLRGWADFLVDLPRCLRERKRIAPISRAPFPAHLLQPAMSQPGLIQAAINRFFPPRRYDDAGSGILYLTTIPPPALSGSDAVLQDVQALQNKFGGEQLSLYPFRKPSRFVPGWLMGWHQRDRLRGAIARASVVHVMNATLKPLPALSGSGRPLVYSVKAALGTRVQPGWFNRNNVTVIVNNDRDEAKARATGLQRVALIKPGIALDQLSWSPPPADTPFRLLAGSAPWTRGQFKTKGFDSMIEAARLMPDLHLVFLWRKLWRDDLQQRIERAGLAGRVTVHEGFVNVNDVLAGCHAAVVLASNERLVKAWPHSAIESLAAGRPVILSRVIPMADYLEREGTGEVVESLEARALLEAINRLRENRTHYHGEGIRAKAVRDFSVETMLAGHEEVYRAVREE